MTQIQTRRAVALPDPIRVARAARAPELGPRLLFFSGGSALKKLSRRLKAYTHNSIHLITPFDSGGSSATLRRAFSMLSIGDLRNRLMALADETQAGNPEIYRLFNHRFSHTDDRDDLHRLLVTMVTGRHPFVSDIPRPLRRLVRTHLRLFSDHMPEGFDLRGASIGNLMLAGGLLNNERDIASVIFLFSKLVQVRGTVRPVVDADLHLRAQLEDGSVVLGQHRLTGKEVPPLTSPIQHLDLVDGLTNPKPTTVRVDKDVLELIGSADAIIFPMGSFYTSVLASLLPQGVGAAVAQRDCPKLYVPNTGVDPEQHGMPLSGSVQKLLGVLRSDATESAVDDLVQCVILDERDGAYAYDVDVAAVRKLGVEVVRLPLVTEASHPNIDADSLSKVLVSIGG